MRKIINPGKVRCGNRCYQMFVEIKFNEETKNLTLHGVIGPRANGNAMGSSGQIVDERIETFNKGWDNVMMLQLRQYWREWHLNDMRAGSPKQTAWLKGYPNLDYEKACEKLKLVGLYEDNSYPVNGKPYRYGTAWLREEVPAEVIEWLFNLPETEAKPAWI